MVMQQDAVARPLVVERETGVAGADLDDASAARVIGQGFHRITGWRSQFGVGRLKRVLGERRQNVRKQQLLMLLLVVDAEFDEVESGGRQAWQGSRQRVV